MPCINNAIHAQVKPFGLQAQGLERTASFQLREKHYIGVHTYHHRCHPTGHSRHNSHNRRQCCM